jgi:hypothetical protein
MSMLHVQVHAAFLCPCCMLMSMLHACGNDACPCPCCISMTMPHVHVNTACSCPCCLFMPMLYAYAHAAYPCSGCMPMPMLYVHAACLQTVSFWTAKYAAFCRVDVNRASYIAVPSLMVKIMEVMVILLRDTAVKACSSFSDRTRLWWSQFAIFLRG